MKQFTFLIALFICLAATQTVGAATYTVTNTFDSGAGSLRQAVLDANATAANDVIVFNIPSASCHPTTGVCTITLSGTELLLANNGSLIINGTGADRLIISGGNGTSNNNRVFNVASGAAVAIRGLTVANGRLVGTTVPFNPAQGAGIRNAGNLTLRNAVVASNRVVTYGFGAGIYNTGTLNITNSAVVNNIGNNDGGGINFNVGSNATLINTTFSGNTNDAGGPGFSVDTAGAVTIRNCTIAGNTGTANSVGGGIRIYNNSIVNITNTIIAGNTANTSPDVSGAFNSQGYNLIGNTTGSTGFSAGVNDILNQPALLDALGNYGGTVPTRRLQTGSPAIDNGSAVAGVSSDGRGVIRPFDIFVTANAAGGNGADIGAFELIPTFARGWGYNDFYGSVGDGTFTNRPSPVDLLGGFADIVSFEGGFLHGLGLLSNGTIVSWGRNDLGQLGRTATTGSTLAATPTLVSGLSNVAATAGGYYHSLAVLADGTVRAWGNDGNGQLGDGSATTTGGITPVTVATDAAGTIPLTGIIAVAGGEAHSIALKSDGTVWTWGNDTYGQLGDGAGNSSRDFAQQVPGLSNVIAIDVGSYHNLAILADGSVRAWGRNGNGEVGDNSTTDSFAPVTPTNLGAGANITQIAAGYQHSVALKTDGTILTWGDDQYGQLGDGAAGGGTPLVPTLINTVSNVTDIKSTLGFTTYARKRDGSIFAWGVNSEGEIGNGTTNTTGCQCQPTPTQSNVGAGIAVFGAAGYNGFAAMPTASVSTGANQFARMGDATVNFGNVATAGNAQIRTFDPSTIGLTVPTGYTILANSTGYDITSSAQFTGTANVCLKATNVIDQTQFNLLYILHDDDGDGTLDARQPSRDYQKREICRATSSFSPFVIAQGLAPTAASVSVSGRVMTGRGRGIRNVHLTLTDSSGNTRAALSSSFGYYRFEDVAAGETYIISASAKRYTFIQPSQVLSISEDTENINFIADSDQMIRNETKADNLPQKVVGTNKK